MNVVMLLFYYHAGDAPLWSIILWLLIIPAIVVILALFIIRKFSETTKSYKKPNLLDLNEARDKENE